MNAKSVSRWSRLRAPVATLAVAGFLGAAIIAPFSLPGAEADVDALAFQDRIHQEFTPNESDTADLVYVDIPVVQLPDPEEVRKKQEAEAAAKAAEAASKAAAETAAQSGGGDSAAAGAPPKYSGGGSPAEWMAAAGIAEADWGYVDYIASRESTWNPNATNASSGACGLIQAYPCSKVPGNGYDPVDNLRWATGYATDRYGSWAAAYAFWTANHWW
ncbi:transglycosylase SLT domain-containing protein [Leucobacter luti]|uniref:Transglycosylase-like protein with SLT domain n=1 Tax=Leucobacter luti TaxID=340320 RepID=A0A4R6RTZ0_9MICO|nr:transglycosylase SLT domain-containing protein [Leucobacter luti]QYM75907.1 transglycosylase SLT domain-containing protein [Leucobacter luti]TDP90381.1 transglycosylase-like protein with SLT domain [Leucobacter luti]